MGTFVNSIPSTPFVFGTDHFAGLGSETTKDLVETRFGSTAAYIDQLVEALLGEDGSSGYLGNLNNILTDFQRDAIGDFTVTIPTISVPATTRPAPTMENLDLDFPVFSATAPTLATLPTINLDGLTPSARPASVSATIDWTELIYNDDTIFSSLLARLISILQTGATGLDATVEAEIIARAQARQDVLDDKQEQETLEFFSSRGFTLPTGAMQAAIAELAYERARNRSDLNGKVLIEQAELAQKNSQFALSLAKELDIVLKDFTNKRNDRNLEFAKSTAANILAVFASDIQAWIEGERGKLENVRTQVEYLKGVVESNKGLVAIFAAEGEAYNTAINGKAKHNDHYYLY